MKTQLNNLDLPSSVWQALYRIDNLLGQPLPWDKRLEEASNILIETLEVDAIWLLTIKPLPPTACGLMHTPLTTAPDARVQMVDKIPSLEENWPPPDSLLSQVMAAQKAYFFQSDDKCKQVTDSDLGDVLFGTLNATPAAIVPFVANAQVVGALVIGCDNHAKSCLSKQTKDLLVYLGAHLGAALYNAYLVEHSQRHANTLRGLNLIAQTITSSLDIDEVIQRTMAGINKILDVEAGSLLLVDEQTNELYFKITLRGENAQITAYRLQPGEGIAGWVVSHNQAVIANDAQADKRFTPKIDQAIGFVTKMVLCIPLLVRGKVIGALEVINKRRGAFDEQDQELLGSMAAALGIALKNADLYQDVQERANRTEITSQITSAINTGHGLSETGKLILKEFGRLLPFDHISLSVLADTQDNIRQWVFTEHGCLESAKSPIPLKDSLLATIIQHHQHRLDSNISQLRDNDRPYPDDQILIEENIKSRLSLLLITGKKPYGCLNIGHRQAGKYGPAELAMLEQLLPQVAVAIEKSWLINLMEEHNTELRGLNHLSEMLFSTTNLKLIIDSALSMLPRLLPGDVQGVLIAQADSAYVGVAAPFDFSQTEQIISNMLDTFGQVSGQTPPAPVYVNTLGGHLPVSPDWQPVTALHLPLLTRLGTLGLIYVASGQPENVSDELWRTLSLAAAQISAAVENALLFQQVEQERARLAAILASSTDAVLVVSHDGQIVLDNPAAWRVMGVETSQSGHTLNKSTRNKTLIELFDSAIQGGKQTGEIPTPDGRTFFANLSPVKVGEAGIIGWVATMQDVSHFAELNELKDEFVNMVSHDLRSPLAAILIAAELIPQLDGQLDEKQLELLKTVENRVSNMQDLIADLLDVDKIEAGVDFDLELCRLVPLLDDVLEALTPHANTKSIQLIGEFSETMLPIMANTTRIRQVIYNLADNAIKYTPHGGQVTIKAFQQDQEIRLQVIDTGIGIPPADQPHIFEKFHRVRDKYVSEVNGTGLGLAIAKGIVEKHNGRIWFESTPGKGSTFTVALPIRQKPPET